MNIGVVEVKQLEAGAQNVDRVSLELVLGHGLAVRLGINDRLELRRRDAHTRIVSLRPRFVILSWSAELME